MLINASEMEEEEEEEDGLRKKMGGERGVRLPGRVARD
jgi:hypothetical protein